jgi:hypothetical protein
MILHRRTSNCVRRERTLPKARLPVELLLAAAGVVVGSRAWVDTHLMSLALFMGALGVLPGAMVEVFRLAAFVSYELDEPGSMLRKRYRYGRGRLIPRAALTAIVVRPLPAGRRYYTVYGCFLEGPGLSIPAPTLQDGNEFTAALADDLAAMLQLPVRDKSGALLPSPVSLD